MVEAATGHTGPPPRKCGRVSRDAVEGGGDGSLIVAGVAVDAEGDVDVAVTKPGLDKVGILSGFEGQHRRHMP